jgi:DNA polymerase I-like protein with 3'-5' exonuclease and polymerase domains
VHSTSMTVTSADMAIKFLDIETNTSHDKIWLCCVDDKVFYTPEGLSEYLEGHCVAAHNGIAFDFPILKKIWGVEIPFEMQADTLVLSRLANPAREGGHSLEAWGKTLGCEKIEYTEFDNPDMQLLEEYCLQDVKVLERVYTQTVIELTGFSERSIQLEFDVARVLAEQEKYGWQVDVEKVLMLRASFKDETAQLASELIALFPPIITERYSEKTGKRLMDGVEEFNPGSRQQIIRRLQGLGAEFIKKTEKGNLILDEDVLEQLINTTQIEQVKSTATKVLRFLLLQKHTSMLENWLSYVDADGAVHGYVNSIGAVTCRCTHSSPNLGQVPSKKVEYGTEMRSCFVARKGKVLVDVDLSGIELRCLAHYMNDATWTKELLEGDVHTKNQLATGLETREQAKTFIYACVTMDTTILTKDGWKFFEQVSVGDVAMTYNSKTGMKEWQPVLEKVYYEDAEVIEMSHSHGFKVKTTPNHRWFVKQRREVGAKPYKKKYMSSEVRTTSEVNTESSIITNAPFVGDDHSTFEFQKEKYGIDWVKVVLSMSSSERKAFLNGFLIADGYLNKQGVWQWCQNVNELSEAALTASYLEHDGNLYVSSRHTTPSPMVVCLLGKKGHITGQKLQKKRLENQPVWCIRTENESFVMRQGNCITITGNTLYGAGAEKIGAITGHGRKVGQKRIDDFLKATPALKNLQHKIDKVLKDGKLPGLDGRKIHVRSAHSALNTLLQSAGAIVAKTWMVLVDKELKACKIEARQLGFIHDELVFECNKEDAERVKEIAVNKAREVQEVLGFRCPIDAEGHIGNNWAEVH